MCFYLGWKVTDSARSEALSPLEHCLRQGFGSLLSHSYLFWSAVIASNFVTNRVLKFTNDFLKKNQLGQIQGYSNKSIPLTQWNDGERDRALSYMAVRASPGMRIVAGQKFEKPSPQSPALLFASLGSPLWSVSYCTLWPLYLLEQRFSTLALLIFWAK